MATAVFLGVEWLPGVWLFVCLFVLFAFALWGREQFLPHLVRGLKDVASPHLWLRFSPWPGNFHMP